MEKTVKCKGSEVEICLAHSRNIGKSLNSVMCAILIHEHERVLCLFGSLNSILSVVLCHFQCLGLAHILLKLSLLHFHFWDAIVYFCMEYCTLLYINLITLQSCYINLLVLEERVRGCLQFSMYIFRWSVKKHFHYIFLSNLYDLFLSYFIILATTLFLLLFLFIGF